MLTLRPAGIALLLAVLASPAAVDATPRARPAAGSVERTKKDAVKERATSWRQRRLGVRPWVKKLQTTTSWHLGQSEVGKATAALKAKDATIIGQGASLNARERRVLRRVRSQVKKAAQDRLADGIFDLFYQAPQPQARPEAQPPAQPPDDKGHGQYL